MNLVLAIALGLAGFALLALGLKVPRKSWRMTGGAFALGLTGFALQAGPVLPGAPKEAKQRLATNGAALVDVRQKLAVNGTLPNQWMVISDAMTRNGQFGNAAGVVLGAIEQNPNNADAWLSLANNLVAHADGRLTPAALYAYRRAALADPQHPGSRFFLGLAFTSSGQLKEGRAQWVDLLASAPPDAPWKTDLTMRLERLDAFIAAQDQGAVP